MGRVKRWPLVLVASVLVLLSGCSGSETNPFDPASDRDPPVVTSWVYSAGHAVWTTDEEALCVVEYGPVDGIYDHYVYESTKTHATSHRVDLLGAADGVEYKVRVRSMDRAGNEAYDAVAALPDTIVGDASSAETMTLSMIDVGWGLSMVLTTPDGSDVLIDAAQSQHVDKVVSFLAGHGMSYFDAAIATHHHGDHIGGYDVDNGIIDRYWIGTFIAPDATTVYVPLWPSLEQRINEHHIAITYVKLGDDSSNTPALHWDDTPGFHVEVLSAASGGLLPGPPDAEAEGMKGNNDSIMLKLSFGGVSFITTGDAEYFSEYRAIDAYGRTGVKADLVQVAHHGNDDATGELWLDNVSPRVALISNAMIEAALEKETVLQGLRAVNADYFVTDRIFPNTARDVEPTHGNLIATTDGETIEITLEEHEW
jgi:competence protein ComEC